jgi:hypothetical protein
VTELSQWVIASKAEENERKFPHVVELLIPANGLDFKTNREILEFHSSHSIPVRYGRMRIVAGQNHCRWCFAHPAVADEFCSRFGGKRNSI